METKIGYECGVIGKKEVVVNLTWACNNHCLSCPNDYALRNEKVSEKQISDFIEKNVDDETDRVTFIGGEPTIFSGLIPLIRRIRSISMDATVQINSNGRMFAYEDFTKKFLGLGRDKLEFHIAIYSPKLDIHEEITRAESSFGQTVEGIRNLLRHGFIVDVRTIVSKKNYKNLPEFPAFISMNFENNVRKFVIVGMDLIGNAWENRNILSVSQKEIAPWIEEMIDKFNEDVPVEIHLLPFGIFRDRYRRYVVKSGCIDGAFTESYGCGMCIYKEKCPKLLRSYVSLFGNREHEPVG